MGRNPVLPLYTGDWKKDPELSKCGPATRGIWVDMLCAMHENRSGIIDGTAEQLARICRCTPEELAVAVKELHETKTARVTVCHKNVTVECRRMTREHKERKSSSDRQKRYRESSVTEMSRECNGDVTPSLSSSSSSSDKKPPHTPLGRGGRRARRRPTKAEDLGIPEEDISKEPYVARE